MEHFTEAEAQRIVAEFARASAAPPPGSGLSPDELREIGRAARLDLAPGSLAASTEPRLDLPDDAPLPAAPLSPMRRTRA